MPVVQRNTEDLTVIVQRVFRQGWPETDADVTAPAVLRAHVESFVDNLETVVTRLHRRLRWAMDQIRRLNLRRESQGTLEPEDESLFRRCDNLVKRLKGTGRRSRSQAEGHDDFNTFNVLAAEGFLPGYGLEVGSVVGWAEIPFWRTGAMDFSLPRPPATALREYVPGNLIYANGHRFVARRFHRDLGEEHAEMPFYEVSTEKQAVTPSRHGEGSMLGGHVLRAMAVCDADLIHTSHISDEGDLRFQLGVGVYGLELGQHSGGKAFRWGPRPVLLRRGVRMRLVNVGASAAIGSSGEFGYPVCTVCGQSVSPLSSERQLDEFRTAHAERCGRPPEAVGFYADVMADALSLPACDDATTAYSVLEALRFGAARVLDMHMDDLQILVIGHVERSDVDAVLWDPMPGDSDEGVCIYLDGLSEHLHGDPETAERDREIRTWLRNRGYEVIEIAANELDDEDAMVRHFRRLASYLGMRDVRSTVRDDRSWFRERAGTPARPTRRLLRLVTPDAAARYVNCVPLVPLQAAAGAFGDPHAIPDESDWEWVELDTARSLRPGMFVAQVVGKSMEPRIPDGAYCLFMSPVTGTRQGRTVLVQLRDAVDPDSGERFTVKRYRSDKAADEDGWRHVRVVLEPSNPEFSPIELKIEDEGSVAVVAELVDVIGAEPPF